MKTLLVLTFSVVVLFGSPRSYAGDLDRVVASLCDYAKINKRSLMRKKLKQSKLKLRRVYAGIQCGAVDGFTGGSLLRVSTFFGAFDSAKYISSQIGKKGISSPEADGKNIIAWTEELLRSGTAKAPNLQQFIDLYKSKS